MVQVVNEKNTLKKGTDETTFEKIVQDLGLASNRYLDNPIVNSGEFTGPKIQTDVSREKGIKIHSGIPDEMPGDTDPFLPTDNVEPISPHDGNPWADPSNAQSKNGSYATADQGDQHFTIWKSFSGLQDAIPVGAKILGITVRCKASVDTVAEIAQPKLQIQLSKGSDTVVGLTRFSQALITSDAFVSGGGANDLWGTDWDRDDFDLTFGVMVTGNASSSPSETTYQIDYIEVIVHYVQDFLDDEGENKTESFMEFWGRTGTTLIYKLLKTADLYIDKANLFIKGTLNVQPQESIAGNTGAHSPFAFTMPIDPLSGKMWTNPVLALTSNDAYTTAASGGDQFFTIFNDFRLLDSIPEGATITGLAVTVEGKVDTSTGTVQVQFTKDGATAVGVNDTITLETTEAADTVGGNGELWSTTWTREDFGRSFGVLLTEGTNPGTISVDHITVTVHYTTTGQNEIKGNLVFSTSQTYSIQNAFSAPEDTYPTNYFVQHLQITSAWTVNGTLTSKGNMTEIADGGAPRDSQAYALLFGESGTLQWDDGFDLKIEFLACFATVSTESGGNEEQMFVGFAGSTATAGTLNDIANTTRRVGFSHYAGSIYAVCADGSAITANEIELDSIKKRHYKIEYTTTSVNFYIDGMLKSTVTTDIPDDAADVYLNFAFSNSTGNSQMRVSNIIFSEKK